FEHVSVRDDVTLEAVTRFLRRLDGLPDHTDQLFVVDRAQRLRGTLPLARLIVADLHLGVGSVMLRDAMKFYAEDSAEDAANAFERYDLVSAPVIDATDTLIGRLTVDAVVDYIRQRSAESRLAEAGLREEEDVFAPVLDSFKNRWAWLAINLVTAFIASRVIGLFEGSIERLVALAALMRAAVMGVAMPWLRSRFGRDPAVGSSLLITACTDSGGFFIFLGLATLFLV